MECVSESSWQCWKAFIPEGWWGRGRQSPLLSKSFLLIENKHLFHFQLYLMLLNLRKKKFKWSLNNPVLSKTIKLWLKKSIQHHLLTGLSEFVLKVSGTSLSVEYRNCGATWGSLYGTTSEKLSNHPKESVYSRHVGQSPPLHSSSGGTRLEVQRYEESDCY